MLLFLFNKGYSDPFLEERLKRKKDFLTGLKKKEMKND